LNEIVRILKASGGGDNRPVSSELLPLVYDELRTLASRRLRDDEAGQTLQPTALVHEAWLRIEGAGGSGESNWNDRAHFFRAAARAMRRIMVDRARAKASLKRGSNRQPLDIHSLEVADPPLDERVLLVDEMLGRLEQEDPESARIISLKFFGGLTNREVAAMEGIGERSVERQWAYAKARLFQMIRDEV
jgi:RNA polymerase sigma factor (TIGR02999 family)